MIENLSLYQILIFKIRTLELADLRLGQDVLRYSTGNPDRIKVWLNHNPRSRIRIKPTVKLSSNSLIAVPELIQIPVFPQST